MRIRRNDQVVLTKAITGAKQLDGRALGKEEKGSVARVLKVIPETDQIIVEGVNYVYRHVRRSQKNPQGGRVAKEAAIHVSNVMLFCGKCGGAARVAGRPSRCGSSTAAWRSISVTEVEVVGPPLGSPGSHDGTSKPAFRRRVRIRRFISSA